MIPFRSLNSKEFEKYSWCEIIHAHIWSKNIYSFINNIIRRYSFLLIRNGFKSCAQLLNMSSIKHRYCYFSHFNSLLLISINHSYIFFVNLWQRNGGGKISWNIVIVEQNIIFFSIKIQNSKLQKNTLVDCACCFDSSNTQTEPHGVMHSNRTHCIWLERISAINSYVFNLVLLKFMTPTNKRPNHFEPKVNQNQVYISLSIPLQNK